MMSLKTPINQMDRILTLRIKFRLLDNQLWVSGREEEEMVSIHLVPKPGLGYYHFDGKINGIILHISKVQ